jgi:hypothetical protein
MVQIDERILIEAAESLADVLTGCLGNAVAIEKPFSTKRTDHTGGHRVVIAKLNRADSDLAIEVWLDEWVREPAFFAGFGSEKEQTIKDLLSKCSEVVAPGKKLEGADKYERKNNRDYQLTETIRVSDNPVLEIYGDGSSNSFGIYSGMGNTQFDLPAAAQFIISVLQCILELSDQGLADLEAIWNDEIGTPTSATALVKVRLVQSAFRRDLERIWGGRCSVTGIRTRSLLRASHIKPFSVSEHTEQRNPHNGLLLCAHLDALFDKGLISFEDDGSMRLSKQIESETRELLQLGGKLRNPPSTQMKEFLRYHREEVYKIGRTERL